jgi:hypothetical protein
VVEGSLKIGKLKRFCKIENGLQNLLLSTQLRERERERKRERKIGGFAVLYVGTQVDMYI